MTVPHSLPRGEGVTEGDERGIISNPEGKKRNGLPRLLRRLAMTEQCHSERSEEPVLRKERADNICFCDQGYSYIYYTILYIRSEFDFSVTEREEKG